MPFDFGGRRPSDRGSAGSGMNMDPMTGKTEPVSPPRTSPSGGGGGFSSLPGRKSGGSGLGSMPGGGSTSGGGPGFGGVRTPRRNDPRPSRPVPSIPFGPILMALAVVGILAVLWYFRQEITEFLTLVLAWAVIIVVIVVVLKLVLFGGRRR